MPIEIPYKTYMDRVNPTENNDRDLILIILSKQTFVHCLLIVESAEYG